jgi:LmbE family N-acetylglucosaminyl deacetylase
MPKPRYKAVFVSPHLDDAVFSCGGEISRLTKEGPVLVLNIFTKYLSEVKVRAVVLGPERYDEEQAAARFLGFESQNLGELDVSFRREAYRSLGNIFRPPVKEDLGDYLAGLKETVSRRLAAIEYEKLYVPLAIGWHVDHVLTFLLFEDWAGTTALIHYEDAPYCLIPHATRHRLNELGRPAPADEDESLGRGSEMRAWWESARGYSDTALMKNLKPRPLRWIATPVVAIYLYRLIALHRRSAGTVPKKRSLEPIIARLDQGEFERKVAAMALYRSQFQEFFLGANDCRRLHQEYASSTHTTHGAFERFWVARPDS